ncbi:hypothetical protein RHGRI_000819 [Rhododendron griersonianum]|uniref:NB-ARC domain-containing protein n=1 Tax=Rhododendron griersonianum TaxID=479676 RepID=A0AAV6LL52_9ERIC|nr:hypothetical protein RHGRI_000819 [Rhododendron griersonianum]
MGVLQDAFANHKKHLREELNGKVEKWRVALTKAANLSGRHLLNDGDEAKLIKMIIEDVRKVNPTHLNVPDRQVGLDHRVAELNVLLNRDFNYVGIVAIWGMGGIGKTTIAKRLSHELSNSHEGIEVIKKTAFGRKKVLVVLDDVDNDQQLKALAIDQDSFAPGSKIIITTRDKSSLKILELGANNIYGPEKLDKDESLKLFSWHAFKEDHPPEDHLDLSHQIVHYAGGLPLALHEVLGSYFRGESILQWESAIAKLRKIHANDVQGKFKISFDSLSEQLKKLFLDMACFFVGIGRDFTVKILEGYDIFAEDEVRKLADRCLIKYDCNDQIVMHDMIRDMGREIVRQESLEDPGKRSRLWYPDDVLEVLRYGTGTESVKGLILKATDVQVNAKAFEKMNNLWLLHLDYIHLTTGYEHISRRLLWLSWKGFPLDCIPWNFSMEKLIALDLSYSRLKKVWNGNMILGKLKFLYLNHCHYLTRTPDFSGLSSLEELLLNDCKSLVEGLSEIEHAVRIIVSAGEEELRICFPFHDGRGPNISFVVPPSPSVNQKMLGWIIRLVVWAPQETSGKYQSVRQSLVFEDVIYNKIRFRSRKFHVAVSSTDVDHVWLMYIPQGYGGLQLEGGDEVEIPIYTEGNEVVKNWVIDVIYEADEIHKGNGTWCQVVSI